MAVWQVFYDHVYRCVETAESTDVADHALTKITVAMFDWLEEVSTQDKKYADLVRFGKRSCASDGGCAFVACLCGAENYHHYYTTLEERGNNISMGTHVEKAKARYEEHRKAYVRWMIKYEFEELVVSALPALRAHKRLTFHIDIL